MTDRDRIELIEDWPEMDSGCPMPHIFVSEDVLRVAYSTPQEEWVVVTFQRCSEVRFGGPNDEVLHGHPLYANGLEFYSFHRVHGSSWIEELERKNSIHERHDRDRFIHGKTHYVLTFHDSTLECVVRDGEVTVVMYASQQDALMALVVRVSGRGHR